MGTFVSLQMCFRCPSRPTQRRTFSFCRRQRAQALTARCPLEPHVDAIIGARGGHWVDLSAITKFGWRWVVYTTPRAHFTPQDDIETSAFIDRNCKCNKFTKRVIQQREKSRKWLPCRSRGGEGQKPTGLGQDGLTKYSNFVRRRDSPLQVSFQNW